MNVVVCIKQVPDTESRLEVAPNGVDIERDSLNFVSNPYDEFAVEEAIRIKERLGNGKVTLLSLCAHREEQPEKALRTFMAMGANRAVIMRDDAFGGGDTLTTATVLSAALRRLECDLLLFGAQAVDDDSGAVGIQVAELLGMPHVAGVEKLELDPDKRMATAHRQVEDGVEVVEVPLPAVIACQRDLNKPRYPSLKEIMAAKKKPLETWSCAKLGLAPGDVGASGAKTTCLRLARPPARQPGRILTGGTSAAVGELVRLLRVEAKVI
ncbi:MAG: electron transfer flavoprotein subunit beta/FixA family protein [Planctomycetota bacterium]